MWRAVFAIFFVSAMAAFSGTIQPLPALPAATTVNAVQLDSSGNIYAAGQFFANVPSSSFGHAFVSKLTPDGAQVSWRTVLAGSQNDSIQAMTLGSDNSVYVTGATQSQDFPTTSGSMQPTISVLEQGFAAKLNPSGAVVYATFIGGTAETSGTAIAVDAAGDAFITGGITAAGVFPTSPGAVTGATVDNGTAFVMELNAAGTAAPVAIAGFGGYAIAVDSQGNIYAAGAFTGPVPTTPGAFETSRSQNLCGTGFFG